MILLKRFVILVCLMLACCVWTSAFAAECSIDCSAEAEGQNICVSGQISNVTSQQPVTLQLWDGDRILYIGQVTSAEDGSFSFDFKLADTVGSGDYTFRVASSVDAEPYDGILEYRTADRIVCTAKADGQNISISGQLVNITGAYPVTLQLRDGDKILYIGQVTSAEDGSFGFDFKLADTVSSGDYTFRLATNAEVEPYDGILEYRTESRIACRTEVDGRSVSILGQVVNAEGSNVLTLTVGDADDPIYTAQTASSEDGGFVFEFEIPNTVASGDYDIIIDSDSEAEAYVGVLSYVAETKPVPYVEAEYTITSQSVNISGQIINAEGSNQVTLTVGDEAAPIYTAQTASSEDGSFAFEFELPKTLPSGSYGFAINTDAGRAEYTAIMEYVALVENQIVDGDLVVSVSAYVPRITGSISCVEGKTVTFKIVNKSDNTIIAEDTITPADGEYALSYTLPSLLTGKDYTVTVRCVDGSKTLFDVNADIASSIIFVSLDSQIQLAENTRLAIRAKTTNSNLIDKSASLTTGRSISTTIPNLVATMSCDVSIQGFETVEIVEAEPEPLPDADEEFQTIENTYSITQGADAMCRMIVNVKKLPKLSNKVFTFSFNPEEVELVDLCGFTSEKEMSAGMVSGTDIEILSVDNGQVTFRVNKEKEGNTVTSGAVNMLIFKKLISDEAVVTSRIEKAQ